MKHFINILGLLILVFFAVGVTYVQLLDMKYLWHLLYLPIFVLLLLWGIKITDDYRND